MDFTANQENANLPELKTMKLVQDIRKLPSEIRRNFASFPLPRKEIGPNYEREKQEREALQFFWGVDEEIDFWSLSIFPEKSSEYPSGHGPPLGDDWPNCDEDGEGNTRTNENREVSTSIYTIFE